MASIADLFGRLLLDDSGFETAVMKSAQSAGDKAGQTLGTSLSRSFKTVGFSALSVVFAGLTANTVQLDTAVKQYAADVGASAEESDKAKAAAIELFKTNRQGYDEILATLAKLRTDQGLTVDQADEIAAAYLRFARVAGGTAPEAVKAFDDIQDAWNLTAAQGLVIMDQLVASNQKYGGSLQQRVADLRSLAPALQALNLDVNDGIALENLFAASGLNASDAQRALNTAVKNLKPGQTFDDLIRQVSAIEDPTLRAQKAIEIFGVKGGTVLAQALRPGVDSLSQFGVTAEDSAGKVKTASDTIDSSIPAQFQLALKNISGTLQELVGPAGPILLTISSLAQLALAFDALKVSAIAGWLAVLGPVALALGAGVAFIALVNATDATNQSQLVAAASAKELSGAQAKLKADAEAGTISWDEYDAKLSKVQANQELQARMAVLAAGGTNAQADAAGKAAVANDQGATAAQLAAMGNTAIAKTAADAATSTTTATSASVAHTAATDEEKAAAERYATAITHSTTGTEHDAAVKAYLALVTQDTTDKTNFLTDAFGRLIVPAKQAPQIFGDVADAATGSGGELEAYTALLYGMAGGYDAVAAAALLASANAKYQADHPVDPRLPKGTGDTMPQFDTGQVVSKEWDDYLRRQREARQRQWEQDQADAKAARDKAAADAKTAAADYARTVEGQVRSSFAAQKRAVDDFFDALHKRRLDDIELARKSANDELEIRKKGLFAEADADQAAFDARHKTEQRQGLVASVQQAALAIPAAGDDPKAILSAVQQLRAAQAALRDFDEQARIDAERATAQTAADAIDAQIQANDAKAAAAVEGENATSAARKKAFDDGLAKLENDLLTEKGSHKKTLAAIAALYVQAGIDTKSQGAQIALGLAAGLLSEVKAVESAAQTLAKAVAKYIKIGSPAEAGPFHENPPESMGRALTAEWWKGIVGGFAGLDLSRAMAGIAGGLALPSMALAGAGGPIAPGAAAADVPGIKGSDGIHVTVDLGTEFTKRFGGNRFIDGIARDLSWRRRS